MWRNDRDRRDDPRSEARETERLSRDEYERPRYGSAQQHYGDRPRDAQWSFSHEVRPPAASAPDESHRYMQAQHPYSSQASQPMESRVRHGSPRPHLNDIRVHELMTRRVATVHPATPVEGAVRLMAECDCGALPVTGDNGILVGMVSDRDIVMRIIGRGREARTAIVADCMTERVFACYANESVGECMRQMARHQVRRMPIVDDRGRLVGIVSQGDLARHAAQRPAREERRALTEVVGAVSQPLNRSQR
jgi:CBS domain-containing protein